MGGGGDDLGMLFVGEFMFVFEIIFFFMEDVIVLDVGVIDFIFLNCFFLCIGFICKFFVDRMFYFDLWLLMML